jgi:tetratricopeptide (TPR) repeat protein
MPRQMNRLFLTAVVLAICSLTVFAQDQIADELKTLGQNEQYDKIIEQYASKSKDYSAKSLYYIGLAYCMKNDGSNCIKFMDLSIKKDAKDPAPHYVRASTLQDMGKHNEAILGFQTAISLKADNTEPYFELGYSYYQLGKKELALEAYKKATKQEECPDELYLMIAQIYSELKENDKALEAYYIAKEKISKKSDLYTKVLFNIGLLELLKDNYDKAEPAFLELIRLNPKDYNPYSKLIQIYYHQKEYDKAKSYKDKLYEAYRKGELKDNLKDEFCFDQFKWEDKLIQACERFEEGDMNKLKIYYKHLFYVLDQNNNAEFSIQTEYSFLAKKEYILCMTKDYTHFNFGISFKDGFKYEDLKKAVIDILEGKIEPAAATRQTK